MFMIVVLGDDCHFDDEEDDDDDDNDDDNDKDEDEEDVPARSLPQLGQFHIRSG